MAKAQKPASKRSYLKQTDVPATALNEALRMPQAILDHYAGRPSAPLQVAKALNVDPKGSQMRVLSGAAIAFGLIEGGAQAASISITDLARRILRPKAEGGDLAAKREAVLKPRVFGDFLRQYDSHPFPRQDIALNVIEDMGVPREKAPEVLDRIEASAQVVGFLEEIKGKRYVSLQGTTIPTPNENDEPDKSGAEEEASTIISNEFSNEPPQSRTTQGHVSSTKGSELTIALADDLRRRRVFITHGQNRDLVEPIKKLLEFGEMEAVVSVERQSVSKPVPEKVLDDMRRAGAAIIHVDAEKTIPDKDGVEHVLLNPNVLIEIGAAMAFYGRRFVLLVREGVKLPSNLQGLYEVRYSGNTLDATSTIKLLEAIKDIKNYSIPSSYPLASGEQ
jgi:predicted nucleotide-binding protein